ncbi:MAG: hypothetical protein J6C85_03310 [Alphaproteobacteria bacterium]|nr:hypothetical protein [Alphaproteobacteria bacterium]
MENKSELRKAKFAVWLYRLFNRDIPVEYFIYVLRCQCCSKDFLKEFVLKVKLPFAHEELFLEEYINKDENLVAAYLEKFGAYKDFCNNHMLIAKSGSFLLYDKLSNSCCSVEPEAQCLFFKELKDKQEQLKFIEKYHKSFYCSLIENLVKMQDCDLLDCFCKHSSLTYGYLQEFIVRSGNTALFETLISHQKLCNAVFDILISEKNVDFLEIYYCHQDISSSKQCELVDIGDKKMLALYVNHHALSDEALILLINKGYKDILKLHYLNYGISERVLAYQANLAHFKSYIGIDKTK